MVMTAAETQILLYYQHAPLFYSKIMIAKFKAMYNCWWSEN